MSLRVDAQSTVFDARYVAGKTSAKQLFHISSDCPDICSQPHQKTDIKQISSRTVQYHDLDLCPECWTRHIVGFPSYPEPDSIVKQKIPLTEEEYNHLSVFVEDNKIQSRQRVIKTAVAEFYKAIDRQSPNTPDPAPEGEIAERISTRIPESSHTRLKRSVDSEVYSGLSEAFRTAVRGLFNTIRQTHQEQPQVAIIPPKPFQHTNEAFLPHDIFDSETVEVSPDQIRSECNYV